MPSAAPNLDLEGLAYAKDLELIHSGQPCMHPAPEYVQAEAKQTFTRALDVYPDPWYFRRYVAAAVDLVRTRRVDVASVATTVAPCDEAPQIMERLFADPSSFLGIAFRW
jgi:threonine dehydrogenase-like Zn-dependent dehydrogenase